MRSAVLIDRLRRGVLELSCGVWGHVVDNRRAAVVDGGARRCRCGARYLHTDGRPTHIRHTLSCFLRHHTYMPLADRAGIREYVCVRCGHPLLLPAGQHRAGPGGTFTKRVRYACGMLGHRVRAVGSRDGFVEYACGCGHSFLRRERSTRTLRHPLICIVRAHRVRFLTSRHGYAEYVCTDCGHPFCFPGT